VTSYFIQVQGNLGGTFSIQSDVRGKFPMDCRGNLFWQMTEHIRYK